jgi:hypothetical protein
MLPGRYYNGANKKPTPDLGISGSRGNFGGNPFWNYFSFCIYLPVLSSDTRSPPPPPPPALRFPAAPGPPAPAVPLPPLCVGCIPLPLCPIHQGIIYRRSLPFPPSPIGARSLPPFPFARAVYPLSPFEFPLCVPGLLFSFIPLRYSLLLLSLPLIPFYVCYLFPFYLSVIPFPIPF